MFEKNDGHSVKATLGNLLLTAAQRRTAEVRINVSNRVTYSTLTRAIILKNLRTITTVRVSLNAIVKSLTYLEEYRSHLTIHRIKEKYVDTF